MSRHAELERYLLDGERLVAAVHQHWGKVAEPVASAVAGLVLALWVDTHVPNSLGWFSTAVWWLWFAVLGRTLYRLAEWRHDWFVATDKRLLLFYGFITRRVSMMPLMKVTDMSYERSVPGRILGYGRFVMESAGQDQALHEVNWVPDPDHHYRVICAEIFGVSDHERVFEAEPEAESFEELWTQPVDTRSALPDPYAGWDHARHSPPGPRLTDEDVARPSDSLYRSEDLRARDRSADTGPIPIRPRRADHDE